MNIILRTKNSLVGRINPTEGQNKVVGLINPTEGQNKVVGNAAITDIIMLKGEPGKSAYEYARDGGYRRTEEEFYNDLANVGSGSGETIDFRVDEETLTLKDGVLSVNTTNSMEQDNTLPITSAGVYATVGNIEALLKTI